MISNTSVFIGKHLRQNGVRCDHGGFQSVGRHQLLFQELCAVQLRLLAQRTERNGETLLRAPAVQALPRLQRLQRLLLRHEEGVAQHRDGRRVCRQKLDRRDCCEPASRLQLGVVGHRLSQEPDHVRRREAGQASVVSRNTFIIEASSHSCN